MLKTRVGGPVWSSRILGIRKTACGLLSAVTVPWAHSFAPLLLAHLPFLELCRREHWPHYSAHIASSFLLCYNGMLMLSAPCFLDLSRVVTVISWCLVSAGSKLEGIRGTYFKLLPMPQQDFLCKWRFNGLITCKRWHRQLAAGSEQSLFPSDWVRWLNSQHEWLCVDNYEDVHLANHTLGTLRISLEFELHVPVL